MQLTAISRTRIVYLTIRHRGRIVCELIVNKGAARVDIATICSETRRPSCAIFFVCTLRENEKYQILKALALAILHSLLSPFCPLFTT